MKSMKFLVLNLAFILALGTLETTGSSLSHTENSGKINLTVLDQIESLISKKAGAELEENHENSFVLNGHSVYTEVVVHRYGSDIYEESFFEIQNPENEFKLRLTKNINGDRILAILIKSEEGFKSLHACFDKNGKMLEEDPWGMNDGYSIEIFNLYNKYQILYSQRVNAK
jgi:hypothetical protein